MTIVDAVEKNDLRTLRTLIENGADINEKDGNWSALMLAAANRNIEAVNYLISRGADLEIKYGGNAPHLTALGWAAGYGYADVAKILIDHGADINAKDDDGSTLLMHIMVRKPNNEVVQLLIENGADVDATIENGVTALMIATYKGHSEIAKLLQKYSKGYLYSKDAVENQTFRELCELFFKRDYETCALQGLELISTQPVKHELLQIVIISLLRSKARESWRTPHFKSNESNAFIAESIVSVAEMAADDIWNNTLLKLTVGMIEFPKVLDQANGFQRCQAYYYYGARLLSIGRKKDAIKAFKSALDQNFACLERDMADKELQLIS